MNKRPRRLRNNESIRALAQETQLNIDDFIYPVFIKEGISSPEEISSMPHIYRHSTDSLSRELEPLANQGLKAIALFPIIKEEKKSANAKEAFRADNFLHSCLKILKKRFPELLLISDVALDPYTDHGHDGLIENGEIINDTTLKALCQMALSQAQAGADIVAPSDMMDGRVKAIRETLETSGFHNTVIMSYTAKYASCLYGPFRDALGIKSSSQAIHIPKDKKTYQMNPANAQEALHELELDLEEGADIIMVKPASWYLDIISQFKSRSSVPVAAYQVSGEYSMIHAAAQKGYIDLDSAVNESLLSIKRAGADLILSYFVKQLYKVT